MAEPRIRFFVRAVLEATEDLVQLSGAIDVTYGSLASSSGTYVDIRYENWPGALKTGRGR